jgi:hypothetical protein
MCLFWAVFKDKVKKVMICWSVVTFENDKLKYYGLFELEKNALPRSVWAVFKFKSGSVYGSLF